MVRIEERVRVEETQMNLLHLLELCSFTVIIKMYQIKRKWAKKKKKINSKLELCNKNADH